jgi:Raf kinase inhibitor-like YbhB/YbcL family protein
VIERLTIGRIVLVVCGATAMAMLSACDTGDGKTLKAYDAADYPSQTVPPTSVAGDGFDDIDGGSGFDPIGSAPAGSLEPFQLFAPWQQGGTVEARNTCDGIDVSPALSWGAVPAGTAEIALALVDDTAVSDGEPFVHWVIAGLDPNEIALVEGDVPAGAVQAINFFGDVGYGGPCPPEGDEPHLYRLTAYALDRSPGVADATPALEFLDAVEKVTLGTADLSATYGR